MSSNSLGTTDELDSLKEAVSRIERETDVEIVPVLAPQSSRYSEACTRGGITMSLLFLALLIYLPVHFPAYIILPDAFIGFLTGYYIVRRFSVFQKFLTFEKERERAVNRQAKLAYFDEELTGTQRRTGMLIYYSALEKKGKILMDYALQRLLPEAEVQKWTNLLDSNDTDWRGAVRMKKVLRKMAPLLKEKLPPLEDRTNEQPDQPVIRTLS